MQISDIDYDSYELLSLDVFDTLLLRAVADPADVFERAWQRAKDEGLHLIDLSNGEFRRIRIEMGMAARDRAGGEVTLGDIYGELPGRLVKDPDRLRELEVEAEIECCYVNPDIHGTVEAFRRRGKRTVLLSDMYLSRAQIERILEENRFEAALVDDVIVSSEYKCSKRDGGLYRVLLDRYGDVPARSILHIGDNGSSDFENARGAGLRAIHYDVVPGKPRDAYEYERIRHDSPQKEILSLRKLAASRRLYGERREDALHGIGAGVAGPFLTMYVHWVCDRLESLGITRVYPLMREGYLLGKMIENDCRDRGLDVEVKPVCISRIAAYVPSLEEIDEEGVENLMGVRNMTVGALLAALGLDPGSFPELAEHSGVRLKAAHGVAFDGRTSLREHVVDALLERGSAERINRHIRQQRGLLAAYLEQEAGGLDHVATVDIGYVGRTQQWTERALDIQGVPHRMKHFLGIGVVGGKVFRGMDFEGYYSTVDENYDLTATICRTTDLVDRLVSVAEGSTVGYAREGGRVVPVKDGGPGDPALQDVVFEGVLGFQGCWLDFRRRKPRLASGVVRDRRGTLKLLHRLVDMPTLPEAEALSGMAADTNFGADYKGNLVTEENLELLRTRGAEFVDRCNASYAYGDSNIAWPNGLVTLGDEHYYLRRALKNSPKNETARIIQEVVERVRSAGVREVALYGAGKHGGQFLLACGLYGIRVDCFVDRKQSLWGSKKEGVEVVSLQEAVNRGNGAFVITSMFSIPEIRECIAGAFAAADGEPAVFSA